MSKMSKNFEINNQSQKYDVEIYNLSKKYKLKGKKKEIIALNNINLKVRKGEIFGLLGPNGAGKTTMVSILTTLIQPNKGRAIVLGHDISKHQWFIKNNVGLMLGSNMIYFRLTGYQNLKFYGRIYNIKNVDSRIKEVAKYLDLLDWMPQYVEKYSNGMKCKLALARILLINPKILFLDEPLLGLDPKSINDLIIAIRNLKKTVFLTTHQMDVVGQLCDRIAFLNKGKIVKVDTQDNFKRMLSEKIKIDLRVKNSKEKLINELHDEDFISDIKENNENITFLIDNENYFSLLFKILQNYPIIEFKEVKPNLNDIFINLIK